MNNNPFENGTDNSFSTEVKSTNPILKILGLIVIVVLFVTIVIVLTKIKDTSETINSRASTPLYTDVETTGTNTTLSINNGVDCLEDYMPRTSCEQFTVGRDVEPGIYTVTINYNFDTIEDKVEAATNYNEVPEVLFELNLEDYQGLNHGYLEDYYEFFLMSKSPIIIQNVPLLQDSNIQVLDNTKALDLKLDLVAQDSYISYDNTDPQAGFYTTTSVLDGRKYRVGGTSRQLHVVEFVPTTYDDYKSSELEDLYYNGNDTFKITDDSMVVVYDDNIQLYKKD